VGWDYWFSLVVLISNFFSGLILGVCDHTRSFYDIFSFIFRWQNLTASACIGVINWVALLSDWAELFVSGCVSCNLKVRTPAVPETSDKQILYYNWYFDSYLTNKLPTYLSYRLTPSRSRWPRGLRFGSVAARLLGLRVRLLSAALMSLSSECCVLSAIGLCDRPIPHSEESYQVWCVIECDEVQQ
jgi:hypothetical protein